jgi:hypothetical protein
VFRPERPRHPETGRPYPWMVRSIATCQVRQQGIDYKALDNGFVSAPLNGRRKATADGALSWRDCRMSTRRSIGEIGYGYEMSIAGRVLPTKIQDRPRHPQKLHRALGHRATGLRPPRNPSSVFLETGPSVNGRSAASSTLLGNGGQAAAAPAATRPHTALQDQFPGATTKSPGRYGLCRICALNVQTHNLQR